MPKIQIRNDQTGQVIYEGVFGTVKECVEQAVRERVCLDHAGLHHANLAHAALDDAVMRHANLDHTNLTGANLSESELDGSSFRNATLHGACLCFSSLQNCNFNGAAFGATDIAGARLNDSLFSTLSAFTLNFIDAAELSRCRYRQEDAPPCSFSRPPVSLQGLALPVVFMDHHLKIGNTVRPYKEWLSCSYHYGLDKQTEGQLHSFFSTHRHLFQKIRHQVHFLTEESA